MSSKEFLSKEKTTIFSNFLQGQVPKSQIKAYKMLLSLTYPIKDQQTFCEHVENLKEETYMKQMVCETFTPTDFSLDSAQSALEKFTANITAQANWKTPTTYSQTAVNGVNPTRNIPTSTNTPPWIGIQNQTGWEGSTPWNQNTKNTWTMTTHSAQGNWKFGNDYCGEAATTVFCDWVSHNMNPTTAYYMACEREISCRQIMPNYGSDIWGMSAQRIFANCFIIQGRSIQECDNCVQYYLANNRPKRVATTKERSYNYVPSTTSGVGVNPSIKKEIAERMNALV